MTCTLVLLLLLGLSAAGGGATSSSSGIFSGAVSNFEVVVPRRVDASGAHLSDLLEHHHPHSLRGKRDVAPDAVHFEVPFKGATLTLELWPSLEFISPSLSVHRPTGRSRRSLGAFHSCHFQGLVKGDPKSKVALSACNGLAGMVRTEKHGTLWIEPVKSSAAPGSRRHHLVFKVANANNKSSKLSCGTEEPRRVFKKPESRRRPKRSSSSHHKYAFLEENNLLADAVTKVPFALTTLATRTSTDDGQGFSESRERTVEVMVVADRSMMDFHDRESATDLETYLLTIMNMVSIFYRIPSLGNRINVVVVKLRIEDEYLQQNGFSFNVTTNADKTLDSFCAWQRKMNTMDEDHPDHHDVAILLTRMDICSKSDKPCGTLGVAHVGGMCDLDRACSVNQDNGLSVAHTVAHELGHNFGMVHDAGEDSGNADECVSRNGTSLHIMTPNFDVDTTSMDWSSCSRQTITRFFDKGDGGCLDDLPGDLKGVPELPNLPAGALYDADHQCRLQYSSLATSVCSEEEDFCSYLWCTVNSTCTTTLRPPADGTNCGHRKWCMGRECVEVRDSPSAVHGGWGEWGAFSECSRTCGGGVATAERECDHPRPAHGGLYCTGLRKRYRVCNTKPCPRSEPGFRATQCASFAPTWRPYIDKAAPCALFCTNDSLIVEAATTVVDGTPCSTSSNDLCIEGKCKHVGCDWRIDSVAQADACGICNGDGSQCVTHTDHYGKREGKAGVVAIAEVPVEAHNIRVAETANSRTFLALGASEKRLFIDGRSLGKGENQDILVAGSHGSYERWGHKELITVRGPTNETLKIYVIFPGKARNLGVKFEYTVKRKPGDRVAEFSWNFPDWSACSVTCGKGIQVARPHCVERSLGQVENVKCLSSGPPPSPLIKSCNLSPCPAKWWSGPWQLCPVTCGPPNTKRHRTVLCVRSAEDGSEFQALPDEDCNLTTRPKEEEVCPGLPKCEKAYNYELDSSVAKKSVIRMTATSRPVRPRPRHRKRAEARLKSHQTREEHRFRWSTGEWTHCSTHCGEGIRKRGVICTLAQNGHRVSAKHCPGQKPADYEPCNRPCMKWTTSEWSPCDCSRTGLSTRTVSCPKHRQCHPQDKPEAVKDCLDVC